MAAEENPEMFTRGKGTPNISGTAVREMLEAKKFKEFAAAMPEGVNSQNIFNILTQNTRQNESLLRSLIRETILSG